MFNNLPVEAVNAKVNDFPKNWIDHYFVASEL